MSNTKKDTAAKNEQHQKPQEVKQATKVVFSLEEWGEFNRILQIANLAAENDMLDYKGAYEAVIKFLTTKGSTE